jgi:hypothetical protein
MSLEVPSPEEVTATWLTERLRRAGHPQIEVTGFETTDIGTGQLGRCIRYELALAGETAGAPHSIVGKFPSPDPTSRKTGVELRNYIKEVNFYRELQPRLRIKTPRCLYAAIDGEGPSFVLLLSDLAPATQGDQIAGCSEAVARAAVLELAGLHAPTWNDPSILGVDWIGEVTAERIELNRKLYQTSLPGFLSRYGDALEADARSIIERVATAAGPLFRLHPRPFALVHIDYRLDNLLIDCRASPPAITVVDWQSITVGSPLGDVAYFLGAGLLPEDRRRCEEGIVREYHERIRAAGMRDYGWSDCWRDYRRGAFAGFGVTVIASMIVAETSRGNAMFTVMAQRHARHALDLGAEEFLS